MDVGCHLLPEHGWWAGRRDHPWSRTEEASESKEYAAALVAYRNRMKTESIILDESEIETQEE